MKTPEELAKGFFADANELRKSSTHNKRLAGTLANLASAEKTYEFTKKEKETLEAAAVVLRRLANNQGAAFKLKKKVDDLYIARTRAVQKLFEDTFYGDESVEHLVSVLAGLNERALTSSRVSSIVDLRFEVKDSLNMVAHTFARKTEKPEDLVSGLWAKFLEKKQGYIDKHAALILRLQKTSSGAVS